MKKILLISVVLFATPVFGQATLPPEVMLKVTPAEVDLISDGLQTQPFGKVLPLMNKLREQVLKQQLPASPASPTPVPELKKD